MSQSSHEDLGPRYLRVAYSLRQKILDGVYLPGERLPPQHELARECGVAFGTLKHALDLLEEGGYVARKRGHGTYACLPEADTPVALVVDDDKGVLKFFEEALRTREWRCVAVQSGHEALEQMKRERFDVLFIDLVMPGMNGPQTFREIRKVDPNANVVIITAYPGSELMAEALEVGPFQLMKKPFAMEELRTVLAAASYAREAAKGRRLRMPGVANEPWHTRGPLHPHSGRVVC